MDLADQIKSDIESNPIILYMKGTAETPSCGFSKRAVQVLEHYGVSFKDVDIWADPEIRVRLSEYSNWPTIPQLVVNGELVGGSDIILELHERGKLLPVLERAVLPNGE